MEKYSGEIQKNISKAFVWFVPLENPRQDNFKLLWGQTLEESGGKQGQLTIIILAYYLRLACACINVIGSSTHA